MLLKSTARERGTSLAAATQYHIYVVAVADSGRSEPSDTVFARTQGGGTAHPELMAVNGGGGADVDLSLLVPIATSFILTLAAAILVLSYICCSRHEEPTFVKDNAGLGGVWARPVFVPASPVLARDLRLMRGSALRVFGDGIYERRSSLLWQSNNIRVLPSDTLHIETVEMAEATN
ncbi:hypothetical protein MRX96_043056 [Rhipicephalus microplus]